MAGGQYWPLRTCLGSGPGQAVPVRRSADPRRLEADVRLVRVRRLLRRARAVLRGELRDRVHDLPLLGPPTDHEDHARPIAGADEDVLGPGRAVEEVPGAQDPFLALDEQAALAGKNEEILLLRLAVVEAVRLAGLEHVQPDAELRKGGVPRLERAFGARRLLRARRLRRQPLRIGDVDDEPPLAHACEAAAAILELGVLHRANLHFWSGTGAHPPRAQPRAARAATAARTPQARRAASGRAPLRDPGAVAAVALPRSLDSPRRLPQGAAHARARATSRRQDAAVSDHAAHHERPRLPVLLCGVGTLGA